MVPGEAVAPGTLTAAVAGPCKPQSVAAGDLAASSRCAGVPAKRANGPTTWNLADTVTVA